MTNHLSLREFLPITEHTEVQDDNLVINLNLSGELSLFLSQSHSLAKQKIFLLKEIDRIFPY